MSMNNTIQVNLSNYSHKQIRLELEQMVDGSVLIFSSGNGDVRIERNGNIWLNGRFKDHKAFDAANGVLSGRR